MNFETAFDALTEKELLAGVLITNGLIVGLLAAIVVLWCKDKKKLVGLLLSVGLSGQSSGQVQLIESGNLQGGAAETVTLDHDVAVDDRLVIFIYGDNFYDPPVGWTELLRETTGSSVVGVYETTFTEAQSSPSYHGTWSLDTSSTGTGASRVVFAHLRGVVSSQSTGVVTDTMYLPDIVAADDGMVFRMVANVDGFTTNNYPGFGVIRNFGVLNVAAAAVATGGTVSLGDAQAAGLADPIGFGLSYSPDAETGGGPDTGSGPTGGPGGGVDLPLSRIRIRNGEETYLQLVEVEVYSDGVNVAPLGTASALTQLSSWRIDNGIDGVFTSDTSGMYLSQYSISEWWEVELAEPVVVDEIKIFNRSITGFRLENAVVEGFSDDGDILFSSVVHGASDGSVHTFNVSTSAGGTGGTDANPLDDDPPDDVPGDAPPDIDDQIGTVDGSGRCVTGVVYFDVTIVWEQLDDDGNYLATPSYSVWGSGTHSDVIGWNDYQNSPDYVAGPCAENGGTACWADWGYRPFYTTGNDRCEICQQDCDGCDSWQDEDGDGILNGSDDDVDDDGIPNGEDAEPSMCSPSAGSCGPGGDADGDGVSNGSDDDGDKDGDGIADDIDATPEGSDCAPAGGACGPNGDSDGDGVINSADDDSDMDGDGIDDSLDATPYGDGCGEAGRCTAAGDFDGDGVRNDQDPSGDADGDGIQNTNDPSPWGCGVTGCPACDNCDDSGDANGDGMDNAADNDDDGDGIDDDQDPCPRGCECCDEDNSRLDLECATCEERKEIYESRAEVVDDGEGNCTGGFTAGFGSPPPITDDDFGEDDPFERDAECDWDGDGCLNGEDSKPCDSGEGCEKCEFVLNHRVQRLQASLVCWLTGQDCVPADAVRIGGCGLLDDYDGDGKNNMTDGNIDDDDERNDRDPKAWGTCFDHLVGFEEGMFGEFVDHGTASFYLPEYRQHVTGSEPYEWTEIPISGPVGNDGFDAFHSTIQTLFLALFQCALAYKAFLHIGSL